MSENYIEMFCIRNFLVELCKEESVSRQCKRRRICGMPKCGCFGPQDQRTESEQAVLDEEKCIFMSLDEYETIRLIDYNQLTQAECATQMNVARTTIQSIYSSARWKMAQSLVDGRILRIEGGEYELCDGRFSDCKWMKSVKRIFEKQIGGNERMKIAVTYENGNIFQHFGHTEQFKLYTIENHQIVDATLFDTNGTGHGALAGLLSTEHIDILICGGIGGGAQMALKEAGIQVYGGVSGNTDAAVTDFLNKQLNYDPDVHCDHHDHEQSGDGGCGSHACGSHGCGNH